MNNCIEEIDHESDDQRQQNIQAHDVFLVCPLTLEMAHDDGDSGSITPCEKHTNPASRPKKPNKTTSMNAIKSTLSLFGLRPISFYCVARVSY